MLGMEGRREKYERHRPQESSQQREECTQEQKSMNKRSRESALKGKTC